MLAVDIREYDLLADPSRGTNRMTASETPATPAVTPASPTSDAERRTHRRPWWARAVDPLYGALRQALQRFHSARAAVGMVLIAGLGIAAAGTGAFVALADQVSEGDTQMLDEGIMAFLGEHRIEWIQASLLEITALGTGLVIMMIVGVAALLLWHTRHRYSAVLLLVSSGGGLLLNGILKMGFDRPRPQIFEWATHASSSSFPSGHAMGSAIVYATVAYLAARLQRRWWSRLLTLTSAAALILLIALSRLYLGVHYPSDVIAGMVIGLAWAAFCMAMLEAIQQLGRRRADVRQDEEPAPEAGSDG